MTGLKNFRVDSFVTSKAIKAPVILVTTANVVSLVGAQTIETVVLAIGDRVLLNAQTDPKDNGIYNVEQTAWNRAGDWDGSRDATNGTLIISTQTGAVNLWELQTTDDPFVPGEHDGTFALSLLSVEEGSFTVNWLGFDAPVSSTMYYRRVGNMVTLFGTGAVIAGTSNAVFKTSEMDLPLSLRAVNGGRTMAISSDNGGAYVLATAVVLADGSFIITATPYSGAWTASGNAQFEFFTMTYLLVLP